jgi:hypothetical protein
MTTQLFIARDPKRIVYVDTDDVALALKIAMSVKARLSGQIEPSWGNPTLIREMVDISLFKNPQDYQGTRYWVV